MSDPFPVPDNLDLILNDIWTRWGRGAADRRSAFHIPVIGTVSQGGKPDQRVMVLRKADRSAATLRFHTDIRSTKASQIAAQASVGILGYDSGAKIQLRATGIASLVQAGPLADSAWAATTQSGRRSYMTTLPPGTPSEFATSGLPLAFEQTVPALSESDESRANFAVVVVTLNHLEWLHLASTGHRRAAFTRAGDNWTGAWKRASRSTRSTGQVAFWGATSTNRIAPRVSRRRISAISRMHRGQAPSYQTVRLVTGSAMRPSNCPRLA
jgi:pyridoxamine 5'-phosphate oxidase